jgi:hypothetical protein
MQTFPLELDNAVFTFNLVQYIPNWYPVKFWISEWAKIKKSIQENFVKKLKSDDNKKIKKSLGLKIDSNLNIRNHNN